MPAPLAAKNCNTPHAIGARGNGKRKLVLKSNSHIERPASRGLHPPGVMVAIALDFDEKSHPAGRLGSMIKSGLHSRAGHKAALTWFEGSDNQGVAGMPRTGVQR